MSDLKQEAQSVVDRYTHVVQKVNALEVKEAAGSLTPADAAFLQSFRRMRNEVALEVVYAKIASNEWPASKIVERMSA
jgi:hypothetical protein